MRVSAVLLLLALWSGVIAQNVTFNINTNAGRKPISSWIYGMNFTTDLPVKNAAENYRSLRLGGNRMTGYNWENNASNAGNDYIHSSDSYLCSILGATSTECNAPGGVLLKFHETANGNYALATLPAAGYVAADKNGSVSSGETAPSARWKGIRHIKGAPFTLTPNVSDSFVYTDEAVNFLVNRLGTAANGGIKGYCLDNEPALWPSTHPRIHPAQTGAAEVATKNIALAKAIKAVDPTAETFGGVFYGFSGYYNMQNAPDWNAVKGSYSWYIDYFLDKFKTESTAANKRLLDVLDIHWYPEAIGTVRITSSSATSRQDKLARMQAPRTLWDSTYTENSWIAQYFSSYLPLLRRMNTSINQYYPGTKLSISEYNYGGGDDISGGIAQADVLGIFGKYGLYSAHMWSINTANTYFKSAFRMYNNYNGSNRGFGNTSISATASDIATTSVYASIDGNDDSVVHILAINKSSAAVNGNFNLGAAYGSASVYRFDSMSSNISKLNDVAINGTSFTYQLAPVSVSHLVVRKGTPLPVHLVSFDAVLNKKVVNVTWKVENEVNMKSYEVLRSCDGVNFSSTATIAAGSAGADTYSFADSKSTACKSSVVYYQLQMNGADGGKSYSSKVSVKTGRSSGNSIVVYPNPANSVLTMSGLEPLRGTVTIVDEAGQVRKEQVLEGLTLQVLDVEGLGKGNYTLVISYENGEREAVGFIKK